MACQWRQEIHNTSGIAGCARDRHKQVSHGSLCNADMIHDLSDPSLLTKNLQSYHHVRGAGDTHRWAAIYCYKRLGFLTIMNKMTV